MKLRSLLFVPADSEHKFAKASGIGADALILDLEDSVAPPRKTLARDMVKICSAVQRATGHFWCASIRSEAG